MLLFGIIWDYLAFLEFVTCIQILYNKDKLRETDKRKYKKGAGNMKQFEIIIKNKEGLEIYETIIRGENRTETLIKALKRDLIDLQDGDIITVNLY